jgi:starvation-inducible DNA-binding protein
MTKPLKNIKKDVMEDDSSEDMMDMQTPMTMPEPPEPPEPSDNPTAESLISSLKGTLADVFSFYLKTHFFHWNIEGPDFLLYHEFLGEVYEDVHGSVDPIGENIRKLGGYAPGSYSRFQELSSVSEASKVIPPAMEMLKQLYDDNEIVIASLERSYELAEMNHEHGISNFLAERDGIHKKYRWFLRSTLANR